MSYEYFIAVRYLFSKKAKTLFSLTSVLSVAGVTLGVMVLVAVIAVMTGAEYDLKDRVLADQPHVLILHADNRIEDSLRIIDYLKDVKEVDRAAPFIHTQVMLRSKKAMVGVMLKGISEEIYGSDPAHSPVKSARKKLNAYRNKKTLEASPRILPGIILGAPLAEQLNVKAGDVLMYTLFSRKSQQSMSRLPAMRRARVVGTFDSGLYEIDKSLACMHIEDLQKIMSLGQAVSAIEIRLKEMFDAPDVAQKIREDLGYPYWARDWTRTHKTLYKALNHQKSMMFVILILIVLVACFSITSVLIMMVMEKRKDIAILKAMGASDVSIGKIFVAKGMLIATTGALIGTGLGFAVCAVLQRYSFVDLPKNIYFFTTLPVRHQPLDVIVIIASTLLIGFLATLYPAIKALRTSPVDGIRNP